MVKTTKKNKQVIVNKFQCIHRIGLIDDNLLRNSNSDIPEYGKIYTLKKAFLYLGYRRKDTKTVFHFKELSHGDLIGYNAEYFIPVDKYGKRIPSELAKIKMSRTVNPFKNINKKQSPKKLTKISKKSEDIAIDYLQWALVRAGIIKASKDTEVISQQRELFKVYKKEKGL